MNKDEKNKQLTDIIKTIFDGEEVLEIEPNLKILEIGETVKGTFSGISDENEEGRKSLYLKTDTGEVLSLPLSSALERKTLTVHTGDYLIISRTADTLSKAGRTVKTFRVFIKK